jgi:polyisoprenoid-binding protein YceI
MKTTLLSLTFLLLTNLVVSQKMITRTGEIKFEATMPGIEEIAGTSKTSSCVLDSSNGDIAALILIKSFKFKSPLMEEHFNENYMESTQFPKATFKGKIVGFDYSKLSSKASQFSLEGELTIHGVSKKITAKINLSKEGSKAILSGKFLVKPQDYNIEIPSLVKNKIAENAEITLDINLEKQ